ncbi:serpin family protein [Brachybacterium huguangmaarense]
MRRRSALALPALALPLAPALTGCDALGIGGGHSTAPRLRSEVPRAEPGDAREAAGIAHAFTAAVLGAADPSAVNLVCSPLSVQFALAMAALGARGATRSQMEEVLGGSVEELAASANALTAALARVGAAQREAARDQGGDQGGGQDDGRIVPDVAALADAAWLQEDLPVEQAFLDALARDFGAGLHTADFGAPRGGVVAARDINAFVDEATHGEIPELVTPDQLGRDTVAVLVNALYLSGAWPVPLQVDQKPTAFTRADGGSVDVPLLRGSSTRWFEDDVCRATALTTGGELGLALVQPLADVPAVVAAWREGRGEGIARMLDGLAEPSDVVVSVGLPAFDIEWGADLAELLASIGLTEPFGSDADFSGIVPGADLGISAVIHEALMTVDEKGMTAAAATAVAIAMRAGPMGEPRELVLDAPFLVVAYETTSRAPLVIGWVGDPTARG